MTGDGAAGGEGLVAGAALGDGALLAETGAGSPDPAAGWADGTAWADTAWAEAAAAGTTAGVVVRCLGTAEELHRAEQVLRAVWDVPEDGASPVGAPLMRALEHAGNYVSGIYSADRLDRLVGVGVGFFCAPRDRTLHSHIAGLLRGTTGRGAGHALKLHQRAWAVERGARAMTWTYDPLVARNAWFNIAKLGARVEEYLVDFYGPMADGVNKGVASDRALVRWDIGTPVAARGIVHRGEGRRGVEVVLWPDADGAPVVSDHEGRGPLQLAVPSDIERLRVTDPQRAAAWRTALRDTMVTLLGTGWSVTGFERTGRYVLERKHHEA